MADQTPSSNVVPLESEELRKLKDAAKFLADMSDVDRSYWLPKHAEQLSISEKVVKSAVHAALRERAMRFAAENLAKETERRRLEQQRVAKQREDDRRRKEEKRERDAEKKAAEKRERDANKAAEREKRLAKQKAEREKRKAEKEAEKKQKEKSKGFGIIMRLPTARHEKELERLAERLGEDAAALREEFAESLGVGAEIEKTEPWPEPVNTATLLQECSDKICRYVVLQDHQQTAAVLWAAHAWLYDHGLPTHSPLLVPTSAEPDSGKTTLIAAIGRTVPRYSLNIEMTGPSLYRFVDVVKPTLVIDEADDLFVRKSDLKHIINAGWTKGARIPRQVNTHGASVTAYFDPFTPKAIALLGRNLPATTRTRSIELRMLPKRVDEKVEDFQHVDDSEFAVLRRKFARWATDNAVALKQAKPAVPTGLNNRSAMNWSLLLAIAELAGGDWPEQARAAAERLTRRARLPSDGVKLLGAIRTMFAESAKKVLASRAIVAELIKDPTDIWVAYNHGGAVTQRQVAHLLSTHDIAPVTVHPSGRSSDSPKGYKFEQFADLFARYLPNDPHIRTPNETALKRKTPTPKRRRKK
jgi:chemotaxis protein histidine kinase CheA